MDYVRYGRQFYRPVCPTCTACRAIRIPVRQFQPSRSQRRCWSRNRDVSVALGKPTPSAAKQALYARYLEQRHDGKMTGSAYELRSLYDSPIQTVEVVYRLGGRLLGAVIADVEPGAISPVYCYFDPDENRRSLGVLNVLTLIDICRSWGLDYMYLGYWIRDYPKTHYMLSYRPYQLLTRRGAWWTFGAGGGASSRPGPGMDSALARDDAVNSERGGSDARK